MAPGLNVCSASQCTGFLLMGSVKPSVGLVPMIGASTGRTKGPSVQLVDWASSWLAARKSVATMLMPDLRMWEAPIKSMENPVLCDRIVIPDLRPLRKQAHSWTMEATHQNSLGHDVSIHRLHHIRLGCVGPQAELGIERIQLVCVVMIGSGSTRAHPHVPNLLTPVQCLDRAIGQLRLRRHSFREFARRAWNIEDHPMQHFAGGLGQRCIRINQ